VLSEVVHVGSVNYDESALVGMAWRW